MPDLKPKGKAIIFSAPSGSGKTTIVRALLQRGLPLEFSVSATSRAQRPNEIDGRDYHFLGINGFKEAIERDALLEWEEVYEDQFYGTLKSEVESIWNRGNAVIFDVDVYGGINIKKLLDENALAVFVQAPSIKDLEERLMGRQTESREKVKMRLAKAEEEIEQREQFDVVLLNDHLEQAIDRAQDVVEQFLSK